MKKKIKEYFKQVIPKSLLHFVLKKKREAKQRKLNKKYAGTGVFCSICKSQYKIFAPFGLVKRENALCLNCSALERHRLLWKFLKDETRLLEGERTKLLHFAPEPSFYQVISTMNNIDYYPVDLHPELFNYRKGGKIGKADITKIPYKDGYFDVIICNHVLEHIPDDRLAMSELFRVMNKEKGWGVFQVPIDYSREKTFEDFSIKDPEEREKAFGQRDHVRWYGRDYKQRLSSVGFKVDENDYVSTFSDDEIRKFGFTKGELIYICTPLD